MEIAFGVEKGKQRGLFLCLLFCFTQSVYGCFDDGQLLIVRLVRHSIQTPADRAFYRLFPHMYMFINRYVKHCDELEKWLHAWILTLVFDSLEMSGIIVDDISKSLFLLSISSTTCTLNFYLFILQRCGIL